MKQGLILLFIFSWCFSTQLFSQVLPLRNYSTETGLASSQVNTIMQDKSGYIWFGCTGGVSRFNGQHFDTYRETNGLPHESCLQLFEDRTGRVWAVTLRGMAWFDKQNGVFNPSGPKGEITRACADGSNIYAIFKGKGLIRGNINENWAAPFPTLAGDLTGICTIDGVLYVSSEHQGLLSPGQKPEQVFPMKGISGMRRTHGGKILFWTRSRVWLFLPAKKKAMPLIPKLPSGQQIHSALLAPDGSLWIGTNLGLFRFRDNTPKFYNEQNGLPGIPVWATFMDRDGEIWFGTNHGAAKLSSSDIVVYDTHAGMFANSIVCFYVDPVNGKVWIGSTGGLYTVSESGKLHRLPIPYFQQYAAWAIIRAENGGYWIGTEGGGLVRMKGRKLHIIRKADGLAGDNVTDIASGKNDTLYVSCKEGFSVLKQSKINTYTLSNGLPISYIRCLLPLSNSHVLLATLGSGVIEFDGREFHQVTPKDKQLEAIYDMVMFQNKLWLATNYGIASFDGETVHLFSTESGLPNFSTTVLLPVSNHEMWVGTDGGAALFDTRKQRVSRILTIDEGLPGNEFTTHNALVKDKQGNIWFGLFGGAARIHSGAVPQWNRLSRPGIVLKKVQYRINGRDFNLRYPAKKHIRIPYGVRTLTFFFDVIWFRNEHSIHIEHKLGGVDDTWVPILNKRQIQARYTNVPAGTFPFKVRVSAFAGSGRSFKKTLITLIIPAPVWQKPVFWILLFLVIAGLVWLIVWWRIRYLKKETEKLNRIVREKTMQVEEANRTLAEKNIQLQVMAETDFLTGLYNRRYFMKELKRSLGLLNRGQAGEVLSLILLDIDHFKDVNDTFGHDAGDLLLVHLSGLLRQGCRDTDLIARFGGEEFIILLPGTGGKGAITLADKIRSLIADSPMRLQSNEQVSATISCGISWVETPVNLTDGTANLLIKKADINLYKAKNRGRNCVVPNPDSFSEE
ncbi:MAG: diguanylate cyclase [Acidobacteria bacterium]|nr:diguanylate cyclase [Acidobacteriota bacterium]